MTPPHSESLPAAGTSHRSLRLAPFSIPRQNFALTSLAVWYLSLILLPTAGQADEMPISVPEGFHVEHYADDDLAPNIYSLTIDSSGRVAVSGPGYVRILTDSDGDGRADGFIPFADGPRSGAQGMHFMGPNLLCSGDGGMLLYRDSNRDDRADGPPETFLKIRVGGEHDAHSIQRGPDGYWYVLAGNMASADSSYATVPTSPLKDPRAGVLMRLAPDLSDGEIIADGYRNPYDFAFASSGDVFTFDSDGERDVSLPWYRPCRVFHVLPRSHAGWTSRSWKRPADFPDMPPAVAAFGRGSPTGVACYQHVAFPGRYQGSLFVLDWTFGRILNVALSENGGYWRGDASEFARGTGNFGFAPTDIEVAPDGSLFVSVGGRGTRGGVYRIVADRHRAPISDRPADSSAESRLEFVLSAPQPLSSWSRARWYPIALDLELDAFEQAATDEGRPDSQRMRAIEILMDVFGGLRSNVISELKKARSATVRARAAWATGRTNPKSPDSGAIDVYLNDDSALVRRFALEALTTAVDSKLFDVCLPRLAVALGSDDRSVRFAAAQTMPRLNRKQQRALALLITHNPKAQVWMAMGQASRSKHFQRRTAEIALKVIADRNIDAQTRFDAVRLLQLALGDVGPQEGVPGMLESYTAHASLDDPENMDAVAKIRSELATAYPSGHANIDRELVRVIAMTGSTDSGMTDRLLQSVTPDTRPGHDIHQLAAVSQIDAKRSPQRTQLTAAVLVHLDEKIERMQLNQDSNWDDRISELFVALIDADSAVAQSVAQHESFGLPAHVLYLKHIPAGSLQTAIDGFARQIETDTDYRWTDDVVRTLGKSERSEHIQLIHEQVDNPVVQDAVLQVMSRSPENADRRWYIDGLKSVQVPTIAACVRALTQLPKQNDPAEQHALLAAARRLNSNPDEYRIRETVVRLLQNNLARSFGFVFGEDGYRPQSDAFRRWEEHLAERFPDYQSPTANAVAEDVLARLDDINWNAGDSDRGEQLYQRLTCIKCHGGRRALGPDLKGVARRFSRHDLFASIVDPSRNVSDRYQLTTIVTQTGRSYSGLIVYESVDGLILRDSAQNTYRIEADEIETRLRRPMSLMPAGLLRDTTDQQLADLYAYLRSLQ